MHLYAKGIVAVLMLFLLFAGCTTKVTNSWKNEKYSGGKFSSILVVGIAKDSNNRSLWENVMADHLRQNGVGNVVTATSGFPSGQEINRQDIIDYVNKNNLDGVLVTRLVDTKKESVYYPPSGSFYSSGRYGYYSSFPSYYRHAYAVDYAAGQRVDNIVVVLETTLFESATQELIFGMSSETFNPNSVNQLSEEVGRKIIQKLKKDQLI